MFHKCIKSIAIGLSGFASVLAVAGVASAQAEKTEKRFEYTGYFRSGTGWNVRGGRQECFTNQGSVANEFRLGNECGIYGEATLRMHFLPSGDVLKDPFFRAQTTFAYVNPANSQYEDSDRDGRDIQLVEAYVEGGNFNGVPLYYWAGKRFYRSVDLHMNDFYYIGNMSGTGGGIGSQDIGIGKMKFAVLQETATFNSATVDPVTGRTEPTVSRVETTNGPLGKTAFDLRIEDVAITDVDSLNFWGVYATTPPGYAPSTNLSYEQGNGYVAGVRYHRDMGNNGFNDFAIMYGQGVMQTLEMNGGTALQNGSGTDITKAHRLRLVEHLVLNFGDRVSSAFTATYEDRDSGASADSHSTWWNVGARPVYYFSENYRVAFEVGHSVVRDDADRVNGAPIGARHLTRVTLAPEVAISNTFFGRPVIRLYATHTFWNDDNKTFVANNSPAFLDKTSGTAVGLQTEVWF